MHEYIAEKNRLVWKSGVVVEKDDTRAEITEDYDKREIKIRVSGRNRKELLIIVSFKLDEIHKTFHGLKYTKLIPCNCENCKKSKDFYYYEFDILRNFVAHKQIDIQCPKSYEMVEVLGLIDETIGREQFLKEEESRIKETNYIAMDLPFRRRQDFYEQREKPVTSKQRSKFWINDSFLLFTFINVISVIFVFLDKLPLYALFLVITSGIFIIYLIGLIILRQDEKLSNITFKELSIEFFKQLPFVRKKIKK
jgi:internalin A